MSLDVARWRLPIRAKAAGTYSLLLFLNCFGLCADNNPIGQAWLPLLSGAEPFSNRLSPLNGKAQPQK